MSGDEEGEFVLSLPSSSTPDDLTQTCPICLNKFYGQEIGSPESCDHTFCLVCIQEWARNTNTCPIDRHVFKLIMIRNEINGPVVLRVPVPRRRVQRQEEEVEGEESDFEEEEDPTFCEVCGAIDREERMLLCDGCDAGYHLECLVPALEQVPIGEWFCPECLPEQMQERPQVTRIIPRTEVAERVRARVARLFDGSTSSGEDENLTHDEDDETVDDDVSTSISDVIEQTIAGTSNRARSSTTTRRKRTYRKRKSRKRKTTRKRRRRRRKRKVIKAKRPKKSIKSRLATNLGMKPPTHGRYLPRVNQQTNISNPAQAVASSSNLGITPLYLFGNDKDLPECDMEESDSDEDDFEGPFSRNALRFDEPIRHTKKRLNSKSKNSPVEQASTSADGGDLLGSIFENQDLLHAPSHHIRIRKDGSLEAKSSLDAHRAKKERKKEKERIKESAIVKITNDIEQCEPTSTTGNGGDEMDIVDTTEDDPPVSSNQPVDQQPSNDSVDQPSQGNVAEPSDDTQSPSPIFTSTLDYECGQSPFYSTPSHPFRMSLNERLAQAQAGISPVNTIIEQQQVQAQQEAVLLGNANLLAASQLLASTPLQSPLRHHPMDPLIRFGSPQMSATQMEQLIRQSGQQMAAVRNLFLSPQAMPFNPQSPAGMLVALQNQAAFMQPNVRFPQFNPMLLPQSTPRMALPVLVGNPLIQTQTAPPILPHPSAQNVIHELFRPPIPNDPPTINRMSDIQTPFIPLPTDRTGSFAQALQASATDPNKAVNVPPELIQLVHQFAEMKEQKQRGNISELPYKRPSSSNSKRAYSPATPTMEIVIDSEDDDINVSAASEDIEKKLTKAEIKNSKREIKLRKFMAKAAVAEATSTTDVTSNADMNKQTKLKKRQEKMLTKFNYQMRVEEEVKMALKPHYSKKRITKEQYKEIMKRTVPKITKKKGTINPVKIKSFVDVYIYKVTKKRSNSNSL